MQYKLLGNSDLRVSVLSLGSWNTFGVKINDLDIIKKIVNTAIDSGINLFDTADAYAGGEAEKLFGRIMNNYKRSDFVVCSKVFFPVGNILNSRGLSRKRIMEAIDGSLLRLKLDYIDIYYCHRYDQSTPLVETIKAMNDLKVSGKILYWGTSNWSPNQLEEAFKLCKNFNYAYPIVEQPQYNLLQRYFLEKELIPFQRKYNIGFICWSPLASGLLTGKYNNGVPDNSRLNEIDWLKKIVYAEERIAAVKKLEIIARKYKVNVSKISIAWLLKKGHVDSIILGVSNLDQLKNNLEAQDVELSQVDIDQIDQIFPVNSEKVMNW